jgi:hypothetical protein
LLVQRSRATVGREEDCRLGSRSGVVLREVGWKRRNEWAGVVEMRKTGYCWCDYERTREQRVGGRGGDDYRYRIQTQIQIQAAAYQQINIQRFSVLFIIIIL